jgi:hypothetical protein
MKSQQNDRYASKRDHRKCDPDEQSHVRHPPPSAKSRDRFDKQSVCLG